MKEGKKPGRVKEETEKGMRREEKKDEPVESLFLVVPFRADRLHLLS